MGETLNHLVARFIIHVIIRFISEVDFVVVLYVEAIVGAIQLGMARSSLVALRASIQEVVSSPMTRSIALETFPSSIDVRADSIASRSSGCCLLTSSGGGRRGFPFVLGDMNVFVCQSDLSSGAGTARIRSGSSQCGVIDSYRERGGRSTRNGSSTSGSLGIGVKRS